MWNPFEDVSEKEHFPSTRLLFEMGASCSESVDSDERFEDLHMRLSIDTMALMSANTVFQVLPSQQRAETTTLVEDDSFWENTHHLHDVFMSPPGKSSPAVSRHAVFVLESDESGLSEEHDKEGRLEEEDWSHEEPPIFESGEIDELDLPFSSIKKENTGQPRVDRDVQGKRKLFE